MAKMSIKYFNDQLEKRLSSCSIEEMRNILRDLAQEVPVSDREAFLNKLTHPKSTSIKAQDRLEQDLLEKIQSLAAEIIEAMENAEERMEAGYGRDDYYGEYDEEPGDLYEEFNAPLNDLFEQAQAAFDYGNLALARDAYQALFELCTEKDEYGNGLNVEALDVDIEEAGARFLRAVFETSPDDQRAEELYGQILTLQSEIRGQPAFEAMLHISPNPLPQLDEFWPQWVAYLQTQGGEQADFYLREAVRLWQGTPGLQELAQREGKRRPKAYVDWLAALEDEDRFSEEIDAAREALREVAPGLRVRAEIADHLCTAAEKFNDITTLRFGRWEAFVVEPKLARLLDIWEATPQEEQKAQMQLCLQYLQNKQRNQTNQVVSAYLPIDENQPYPVNNAVLLHARLLSEDLQSAYETAAKEKVLGWSSSESSQGLVLTFLLLLLAHQPFASIKGNLIRLWQQRLSYSSATWFDEEVHNITIRRLEEAYAALVLRIHLTDQQETELLSWCLSTASQRIEAIVGGLHRGSYDKAAMLAGACAETLHARGDTDGSEQFFATIRGRFPRHSAFQAELKLALQRMSR